MTTIDLRNRRRGNARRGYPFGDGTGLDADTLDSQHGSYYTAYADAAAAAAVAALVAGFKRGEMYNFNTPTAVTIGSANTWVAIASGFTGGDNEGVTFQNARELKIVTAGTYLVQWSLSLDAAAANVEVEGGILVNGTVNEKSVCHLFFATANDTGTLKSQAWIDLVADDIITLGVNNNTSATNVSMEHSNVNIARWPQ